jgi:hypothetical protein
LLADDHGQKRKCKDEKQTSFGSGFLAGVLDFWQGFLLCGRWSSFEGWMGMFRTLCRMNRVEGGNWVKSAGRKRMASQNPRCRDGNADESSVPFHGFKGVVRTSWDESAGAEQ